MKSKNWFEVDTKGLRELQAGKPKSHLVRELIQNALDEAKEKVRVDMQYNRGTLTVIVEDDGIGFRDLKDAYTLFGNTYKRADHTKRGRFNIGEKQAFSLCKKAIITTTSGTVVFDDEGRHRTMDKTSNGTTVSVSITQVSREEYEEIKEFVRLLWPPKNIHLDVLVDADGQVNKMEQWFYRPVIRQFNATLETELLENEMMSVRRKPTSVELTSKAQTLGKSYLYEMGIPVCEIDCEYSINVQQRIPMSMDRDKVSEKYMRELYALVLNETHDILPKEKASDTWVRVATTSDKVSKDAVETVKKYRYGDKVVIANPFDKKSIDEAIASGFRVVYGSEMSKQEWDAFKGSGEMQTTTELFGEGTTANTRTLDSSEITEGMEAVSELVNKLAIVGLGINIECRFVESDATHDAWYMGRTIYFNVKRLKKSWFNVNENMARIISLSLHELGHYEGKMHTEIEYHETITRIAGKIINHILINKGW